MAQPPRVELLDVIGDALATMSADHSLEQTRFAAAYSALTPEQQKQVAGHVTDKVWEWLGPR